MSADRELFKKRVIDENNIEIMKYIASQKNVSTAVDVQTYIKENFKVIVKAGPILAFMKGEFEVPKKVSSMEFYKQMLVNEYKKTRKQHSETTIKVTALKQSVTRRKYSDADFHAVLKLKGTMQIIEAVAKFPHMNRNVISGIWNGKILSKAETLAAVPEIVKKVVEPKTCKISKCPVTIYKDGFCMKCYGIENNIIFCKKPGCDSVLLNDKYKTCNAHRKQGKEVIIPRKDQSRCVKCNVVFDNFMVYNNTKLSMKCKHCHEVSRASDLRRPKRIKKDYARDPVKRAQWKKLYNSMKKYEVYRKKKIEAIGIDEYRRINAENAANWRKANGKQPKKYSVSMHKTNAFRRGLDFDLSTIEAQNLIDADCFYCSTKGPGGIDRLYNEGPYTKENSVSCCNNCNMMKHCMDPLSFYSKICVILGESDDYSYFNDYTGWDYKNYNKLMTEKGKPLEISAKEYNAIKSRDCYICKKSSTAKHINGIDRYDNSIGYTKDNCRPCCADCNYMKKDMNYEDFVEHAEKIYKNFPEMDFDPSKIQTKPIVKNDKKKTKDEMLKHNEARKIVRDKHMEEKYDEENFMKEEQKRKEAYRKSRGYDKLLSRLPSSSRD